jgi:hypothetical protein
MCRAHYESEILRCLAQTTQATTYVSYDFLGKIISGGYLHMFLNRSAQLMSRKRGVSLISCTLLTLCTYESVACRFGSPF